MRRDLMFYNEYERFYEMTVRSKAFASYCKEAFGADLSQDGFSDLAQIGSIMGYFPEKDELSVLDVGCGSGKLLKYLHDKIKCKSYGFDYSENAVRTAKEINGRDADIRVGIIGETDYPSGSFDVILSMDSIYFAGDMSKFVKQANGWLKPDGVFIVGYQEGDVMPKTPNCETTAVARAFRENDIGYECLDITADTYEMLLKKRRTILAFRKEFEAEGISDWFDVVLGQTSCAAVPFDEFRENNARYIYIARRGSQLSR